MSFWVYLKNEKDSCVKVKKHEEGGTRVIGGTDDAELNITYNYSRYFYEHLSPRKGLRWLNGKKASNTIRRLEKAIKELGVQRDMDYWATTSGNAGYALSILLDWAKQHTKAIFYVS